MMSSLLNTSARSVANYDVRYAETDSDLRAALEVENVVFRQENFLPVETLYQRYLDHSVVVGVFTPDGRCHASSRLIGASHTSNGDVVLPPMFDQHNHYVIDVTPERWTELAVAGKLAEFATLSVSPEVRGGPEVPDLMRLMYRHLRHLTDHHFDTPPCTYGAMIMSPAAAWGLQMRWHWVMKQVGPEQHYMEGTPFREEVVTAPYIVDLVRYEERVASDNFDYFRWMHDAPMTDHEVPKLRRLRRDNPLLSWESSNEKRVQPAD